MNTCKNCNHVVEGNYCSNCGHPQKVERINGRYILQELSHVFNFEKGIFLTIKELMLRPGKNIREFISEDRNRLVKPILFLFVTSLIYTISVKLFKFDDGYLNVSFEGTDEEAVMKIFTWISANYGYANIMMAAFIALWIKILFRKHDENYFEILILLCFIMGMTMLFYTVFGIAEGLTGIKLMQIGAVVGFIYTIWAIGQYFDRKRVINYIKALLAYLLGMLASVIIGFIIGLAYAMIF